MVALSKKIGRGIYSVSEAAFYARIRTQTLSRWLFGNSRGEAVVYPEFDDESKTVSFLDFVQALAIRSITTNPVSMRMPVQKIREAVEKAKEHYGIDYPLAMRHKIFVFGKELLIKTPEDDLVQITGKHKNAMFFKEIADAYMRKLDFGRDGLANAFNAWGEGKDRIVMDPKIRFGEPMFPENGFTVETLYKAVESEGTVENAAKCYGVEESTIYSAIEFFDHLRV